MSTSEFNTPEILNLALPKITPLIEDNVTDRLFTKYKYVFVSELGIRGIKSDYHGNRLQHLRKELNQYIKETEWMYEPVDKRESSAN